MRSIRQREHVCLDAAHLYGLEPECLQDEPRHLRPLLGGSPGESQTEDLHHPHPTPPARRIGVAIGVASDATAMQRRQGQHMNNDKRFVIETDGLTKRFGNRVAVDEVDLHVPRGSAFGYLGPNGAGKTTLIRMLLGLTKASSGEMRLLGRSVPAHRAAALARVGAIVEEPRFHGHLTGRENLTVIAAAREPEAHARIDGALARTGLSQRAGERVKGYSLGMRQRLGVARSLLADPELLILDEPTNGLDPAGMREFRHMIRGFVAEGRTVLLSSHLLDEVEKVCDFVAIVDC